MAVNKQLGPYGLQLYLYLAANADGFNLELSPQHAENDAEIRRTTFYEYMRKLEINGYLVWKHSNVFDFYTTPRPADERTHPDKHKEGINFEENPACESLLAVNPQRRMPVRRMKSKIRPPYKTVLTGI